MPRILLLNHYLPPDPAPTGRLLGELGDHLAAHGWEVETVAGADPGASYRSGSFQGKTRKLLGWIRAHGKILWRGLRAAPADIVVCLTDPPFLLLTGALVARFHRARFIHWVMDLYPDLASELGELPVAACAVISPAMRLGYQAVDTTIVLDSSMAERLERLGSRDVAVIPPWVLTSDHLKPSPSSPSTSSTPSSPSSPSPRVASNEQDNTEAPTFTWLYSGNLGRSHLYQPLLMIQHHLESRGLPARLVFQGGGAAIEPAKAYARELGLTHCEFRDYLPDAELLDSLLRADVLVATLAEPLAGMLWPSKLALLKHLERPLLWIGPEGDISAMLASHSPPSCAHVPSDWRMAAEWLESVVEKKRALSGQGIRINSLLSERNASLETLRGHVEALVPKALSIPSTSPTHTKIPKCRPENPAGSSRSQ